MLRKLILMLLSSLFIALSVLWVTTNEARKLLLVSGFYKQELHDYALVDSLYDELLAQLETEQASLSQGMTALEFSAGELSAIMNKALPPQWIEDQIASSLDQAFDWLDTDDAEFDLTFDIARQKKAFKDEIEAGIEAKERSIPLCTTSQLIAMQTTGELLFTCRPAGVTFDQFLGPQGTKFFDTMSTALPDTLSLREIMEGTVFDTTGTGAQTKPDTENYQEFLSGFQSFRQTIHYIDTGFTVGSMVLLGIMALVLALTFRKPRSLLRWVGYATFMAGILLTGLRFGLDQADHLIGDALKESLPSDVNAQLSSAYTGIPHDLIVRLSDSLSPWAINGLSIGLSCFTVLIIWWIVRMIQKRKKAKATAELPSSLTNSEHTLDAGERPGSDLS